VLPAGHVSSAPSVGWGRVNSRARGLVQHRGADEAVVLQRALHIGLVERFAGRVLGELNLVPTLLAVEESLRSD
jgi:hypothetical protein